jgi:hypothetical protein
MVRYGANVFKNPLRWWVCSASHAKRLNRNRNLPLFMTATIDQTSVSDGVGGNIRINLIKKIDETHGSIPMNDNA